MYLIYSLCSSFVPPKVLVTYWETTWFRREQVPPHVLQFPYLRA